MTDLRKGFMLEGDDMPDNIADFLVICDKLGDEIDQAVCIPISVLEDMFDAGGARFFVLYAVEKGYIVMGGVSGDEQVVAFTKHARRMVLAKEQGKIIRADIPDTLRTVGRA